MREFRSADAPALLQLFERDFPEEQALMGMRPDDFLRVVRRIYRWDVQLFVRLAALLRRPIFRFFVIEADGRLVGTTILTFPRGAGYVSSVAVDPAYRRRGFAKQLLQRAGEGARRAGRRYLVLDVLANNTPARTLYEAIGFRPLREVRMMVREGGPPAPAPSSPTIRPFRSADVRPLTEIARRAAPPEVEAVMPVTEAQFGGGGVVTRTLEGETAAWVIDAGRGPEAYVSASRSPAMVAAHLSGPVIGPAADPAAVADLVRTGIDWCAQRGAPRILSQVAVANATGRSALEGGGFHDALALWTLYRPLD